MMPAKSGKAIGASEKNCFQGLDRKNMLRLNNPQSAHVDIIVIRYQFIDSKALCRFRIPLKTKILTIMAPIQAPIKFTVKIIRMFKMVFMIYLLQWHY